MSMKKSSAGGGRLSISAALSRNTSLDSSGLSVSSQAPSATAAKYERRIKTLKEENSKLRKDLENIQSLYNQLTSENSHEKFDERRITLLKSQVIQLERQVILMSEALSSRSQVLLEVENSLTWLTDKWRGYIALDIKGPEVAVQRSDITQMVHTAESARIKLYKNVENTAIEKLTRPAILMEEFLQPGCQGELTMLDIASGKLEHLNLKHIGKLETKLASLYKELISLHEAMNEGDQLELDVHHASSGHMIGVARDRLGNKILKSCAMTKDCCGDLTSLTMLYPAAPWPPLKMSLIKDITLESVLKALPALPRGKATEVHKTLEALMKAFNLKNHLMNQEIKCLKEDVRFHKSVYKLQLSYVDSLFKAIKEGYKSLEASTDEVIVTPLKKILGAYSELKETASEDALKGFLTSFEGSFEQIEHAVDKLSLQENNGAEVFSHFGEDFFRQLDNLVKKCQEDRDKKAAEKEELKKQQEQSEEELQKYLEEQEYKYRDHSALEGEEHSELGSGDRQEVLIYLKEKDTKNKEHAENVVVVESNLQDSVLKEFEQSLRQNGPASNVHARKPWNDSTVVDESRSEEKVTTMESVTDSLPPQTSSTTAQPKKKKPKNYTPNTFVPNKTLQLRRSGSMSKLDETMEKPRKPPFLPKMNSRPGSSSEVESDDNGQNKSKIDEKKGMHRRSSSLGRPRSKEDSNRSNSRSSLQRSNSKSRLT